MRTFLLLARMRVLDVLRSRAATLLFLGLPLVVLLVLALVFAHGHPFERRVLQVVGNPGAAPELVKRLEGYPEVRVDYEPSREVALERLRARAVAAVLSSGDDGALALVVAHDDQLFGHGLESALGSAARLRTVHAPAWGYLRFLFPGILASAVMFAGLFSMGYSMARYRQNSFLKKLATTPLGRGTFVAAQVSGRALLVLGQVGALTVAAALLFGFPLSPVRAASLALVALLGLFVFCGLGFALAAVIKAEAVVNDVISALGLPIALLSGIFFPISSLPVSLQAVCRVLPSTLLVDAARGTLLYGTSLGRELPSLLGLALWGLAAFALSLSVFRWHD